MYIRIYIYTCIGRNMYVSMIHTCSNTQETALEAIGGAYY
jgi:hypothetical protein